MNKKFKFLMRLSLKTFLILCVGSALIVAWLANEHRAYQSEQALIDDWAANTPRGAFHVVTNGESNFRVGGLFM